jgi:hypothetical protein
MKATILLAMVVAPALFACQDDRSEPLVASPVATAVPSVATAPTCPCWDAEALAGALPEADACFDQTAAETPFLSVDLFDPAAATQTQAFTRYDAATAEAGSCRLAVVGTEGLVAEIAAATGLPRADYEGCAALLVQRARSTAAGC